MIEYLLYLFSIINTGYVLILSIAGHFYKCKPIGKSTGFKKILILVPAYKEDAVIERTLKNLLQLNYPKEFFDVVLIADSFKQETIQQIADNNIILLQPIFNNSMKCKALNYALAHVNSDYDIVLIVDADNLLSDNFLINLNYLFQKGYTIIQAQRVAKNNNTNMAILDGLSEAINNHLFRQGTNAMGLSSALIGSGMAFPCNLLKDKMSQIDSPVEDKELQIAITEANQFILYHKDTIVYDEKVSTTEAYKNQRRRWIGGQYLVLRKNFIKSFKLLFHGNINYFNLAFIQNFLPSRIHSLIYLLLLSLTFSIYYGSAINGAFKWWALTGIYITSLIISIPKKYYNASTLRSIIIMPIVVFKTIQATLLARKSTKSFIHTKHTAETE